MSTQRRPAKVPATKAQIGQVKAGRGPLIGDAGEHYVVAELLRRGWLAALAPRNSTAFDVLATRGDRTVKVRVKTRTSAAEERNADSGGWIWNAKPDGSVFRDLARGGAGFGGDYVVAVAIPEDAAPSFWIVPTIEVDRLLSERHARWAATPGRNGARRDAASKMRRLREADVEQWAGAWFILNNDGVDPDPGARRFAASLGKIAQ